MTAIWFNPVFVSGWIDGGYDILDFYRIVPCFGTNNDLVELVQKCRERGVKVLLDLVAGHTSDRHPWFLRVPRGHEPPLLRLLHLERPPAGRQGRDLEEMLEGSNFMQNTRGRADEERLSAGEILQQEFLRLPARPQLRLRQPGSNHPWEQSVDAPGPAPSGRSQNIMAFWYEKGVDSFPRGHGR